MRSFEFIPVVEDTPTEVPVAEQQVEEPVIEEPEVISTPDAIEETGLEIASNSPRSDSGRVKKLSTIVGGFGASILSAFTGA